MAKKKKYESFQNSPGVVLGQLANKWQKEISEKLEQIDLNYAQFLLLNGLSSLQETQSDTTQTKLSEFTGVDVMMTSQLVRKLESKGYLKRKSHESDSRAKKVSLTKKGQDLVENTLSILEELDTEFFASVKDPDKLTSVLKSAQTS